MGKSNLIAEAFSIAWGLKDNDYSNFFVQSVKNEIALNREGIEKLTLDRLKEIVKYAQLTSKYYSELFSKHGVSYKDIKCVEDIKKFPVLNRDTIRNKLTDIISNGQISSKWKKRATGGTTSSPVEFYCDDKALWRKNATAKVIDSWYGRKTGDRVAYLWGAPQDLPSYVTIGMRIRNFTHQRTLMLPSAPLDDQILASHYKNIEKWKPSFLQAYPTPLNELCLFMQKHNLTLPSLRSVSVTAETLYDNHRNTIEKTLGLKIFNWYGSRELGRVASECEYHAGLHINEQNLCVEIETDPFLPDGCGHIIVTDLLNRATPLIRYKTGDIGSLLEEKCPCGRNLKRLGSVEGRLVDLIVLSGGRKVPGVSLTNRVIKDSFEIIELQIVQKTIFDFVVRYVRGPKFNPTSLEKILQSLCTLLNTKVTVSFEECASIPRERSGKVRFVISEVSKNIIDNTDVL